MQDEDFGKSLRREGRWLHRRRFATLVCVAVLAGVLNVAAAGADTTGPSGSQTPTAATGPSGPDINPPAPEIKASHQTSKPASKGAVPNATAAGDTFYCNTSGVAISATPAGYVIGDCTTASSTVLYRSFYSDPVLEEGAYQTYQGGYVFGEFQSCGWIRADRMTAGPGRGRTNCLNSTDFHNTPSEYAYYANCGPSGSGVAGEGCTDGSDIPVTAAGCALNRNVRPWSPRWGETGAVRALAQGEIVKWRYVTADNNYVMVRVSGGTASNGGWGFVYHGCFTSSDFSNPNGHPPYFYRSAAA